MHIHHHTWYLPYLQRSVRSRDRCRWTRFLCMTYLVGEGNGVLKSYFYFRPVITILRPYFHQHPRSWNDDVIIRSPISLKDSLLFDNICTTSDWNSAWMIFSVVWGVRLLICTFVISKWTLCAISRNLGGKRATTVTILHFKLKKVSRLVVSTRLSRKIFFWSEVWERLDKACVILLKGERSWGTFMMGRASSTSYICLSVRNRQY